MKSAFSKIVSILIVALVILSSLTIAFAEKETAFVSEPGSVLIGTATKGVGKVTGAGLFQKGDTVTLTAVTDGTHDFIAWYDPDGNVLSNDLTLTFTAEENCIISAEFESRTPEEREAQKSNQINKYEIKRQAIWISSIIAVVAVVIFLVIVVEKKRSKEDK